MASTHRSRRTRQVLIGLGIAERHLATRVSAALRDGGLPYAQFVLLATMAALPDRRWTVTALARALESGQPGVSKLLGRLEARGLVAMARDPRDGRMRRYGPTAAGLAACRQATERLTPEAERVFAGWRDEDVDALHDHVQRLKSDLRRLPD